MRMNATCLMVLGFVIGCSKSPPTAAESKHSTQNIRKNEHLIEERRKLNELEENKARKLEALGDEEDRIAAEIQNMDPKEQLLRLEKSIAKTVEQIAKGKRDGFTSPEWEAHLAERLKDQHEQRYDMLKKSVDAQKAALATQKEAIAAAEREAELVRERGRSIVERIGHLNAAEKIEIAAAQKRILAGQGTQGDFETGEKYGFAMNAKANALVKAHYEALGQHFLDHGKGVAQQQGVDADQAIRDQEAAKADADARKAEHDEKAADGELQLAQSLLKSGDRIGYRNTLKDLIRKYPDTKAAKKARKALK